MKLNALKSANGCNKQNCNSVAAGCAINKHMWKLKTTSVASCVYMLYTCYKIGILVFNIQSYMFKECSYHQ